MPRATMDDFHQLMENRFAGRVAWLGLGNPELGDDGAGLELALRLRPVLPAAHTVLLAGTNPDRWIRVLREQAFPAVVFLDAVEFGAAPGSVAWFASAEFESRFPALSTHKIPLSLLARLIGEDRDVDVSLIGIQPASLRPGRGLSPEVAQAVTALTAVLAPTVDDPEEVPCR